MLYGYTASGFAVDAIRDLLKEMLSKDLVSGVLVPVKNDFGDGYFHVFTREQEVVERSMPVAPVMGYQGARALSKLTQKGSLSKKALAVLRPCEVRAARELSKINQVDLGSFVIVSFECPGVYPLKDYLNDAEGVDERFLKELESFSLSSTRQLCGMCEDFTGELADIEVKFANRKEVLFLAHSDTGRQLLEALGKCQEIAEAGDTLEEIRNQRHSAREDFRKDFGAFVGSPDRFIDVLSSCINCHNCRSVCPICYCRECFFDSTALRVSPQLYIERAQRKGGLRFLPDTVLFHLGRMNHMSLSCVSCGMCEDACPMNVPVGRLFSLVSERVRAVFDYKPGYNLEEPIPVLDYKTEELEEFEIPYLESRE